MYKRQLLVLDDNYELTVSFHSNRHRDLCGLGTGLWHMDHLPEERKDLSHTGLWKKRPENMKLVNLNSKYICHHFLGSLQWGTVDAEIKTPHVENPEQKDSPFKAWSRSEI